jgi:RNA polymerase sigma factor (sigma-70 family)
VNGATAIDDLGHRDARHAAEIGPVVFEVWYRREYPRLVSLLIRLGSDIETARDLAAEAFSRALDRWERVAAMASPTGWTFNVALNLQRRHARRARLEAALLARHRLLLPEVPDREIWDAVRKLANRQRTAVALHYLADLPYADVARVMGVTQGTVAATLASARRQLALALPQEREEGVKGG